MRTTPLVLALLPLVTALACGDKGDGNADDTGADGGATDGGAGDGGAGDGGTEGGCITVDGAGGYSLLQDAIAAAPTGGTISLATCTGTHSEAVTVDKAVTIRDGNNVVLTADGDVPLTVTGDGAVLVGLIVESSVNGVLVDEASDVQLVDLTIRDPGGWGVRANDAEGLQLSSLVISRAEDGGLRISGGSVDVVGADLSDLYGYGIRLMSGAVATVSGSRISGVSTTGGSSTQDGIGISVEASTLTTSSNQVEGVLAWSIYAEDGTVQLSGDSLVDGTMGVLAFDTTLSVAGVDIRNPDWCGIYAYNEIAAPVVITGSSVLAEDGQVQAVDPATWGDQAYIGAGLFLIADQVDVSDTTITGSGGVGALVSGVTAASVSLDTVTVSDVDQYGLYLVGAAVEASDLVVQGVSAFEADLDTRCGAVDQDVAVLVVDGSLDWQGGQLSEAEGYGLSAVYADASVTGVQVSDTECAGLMGYVGSLAVTDSELDHAASTSFGGAVTTYLGTGLLVSGSTFQGNASEILDWSYDYSGGVRHDYYAWVGSDVQVFYGGHAVVTDNDFSDGVGGIEVYSDASYGRSTATLQDNRFSRYKGSTVVSFQGSEVEVDGHEVDGYGVSAIYCEDATLQLQDVTVSDGGTLNERYEVYTGGVLTDTSSIASYGPAVYANGCSFEADGLTVGDADAWGVYVDGGTNRISGLSIDIAGRTSDTDALSAYAEGTTTSLSLTGADISQADRYGIVGYTSGAGSLNLTVTGASVDRSGLVDVLLQNDSPSTATAIASFATSSFSESAAAGLYSIDFDVTLNSVSVGTNDSDGIYLDGGRADIKGSTVYDNAGYGLYCASEVAFVNCQVEFSGNAFGDALGCDPACTGDEGGGDTGDTGSAG